MAFVWMHAVFVGGWLLINAGAIPVLPKCDPFPFVMLAMIASVEAIFLSTFVLITQNRMQRLTDQRADLDLQISLLAEHEVTWLIEITEAIAKKLEVGEKNPELEELERDVAPEQVLEAIEEAAHPADH